MAIYIIFARNDFIIMKRILIIFVLFVLIASCQSKQEKASLLSNEGVKKFNKNNFNGALKDFDEAIALFPDLFEPYFFKGNIYYSQRKYHEAINCYSIAIKLNPTYKDAYYNRGLVYQSINIRDSACLDWKKAAELGKGDMYEKLRSCQ